jgi:hypothetical protein
MVKNDISLPISVISFNINQKYHLALFGARFLRFIFLLRVAAAMNKNMDRKKMTPSFLKLILDGVAYSSV